MSQFTLYYTPGALLIRKNLVGPIAPTAPGGNPPLWNVQEWDLQA